MTKPLILKAAPVSGKERERLRLRYAELKKRGIVPCLKVVLVGEDPASLLYTARKEEFVRSLGAECEIVRLKKDISSRDFVRGIHKIVGDRSVHGCLIQLPLPPPLSRFPEEDLIPREKDVDGFHSENLSLLLRGDTGEKALLPCTPKGVVTLLSHYDLSIEGRQVAILGRSMIVGKPMALLVLNHNGTPTLCHSKTAEIGQICRKSDVIISAVGKAKFLDDSYIGANFPVVVDVGINRDSEGKLCGDVDFKKVASLCHAITPVPGGVGPMTVVSLAQNLLQAVEMQEGICG